MRVVRVTLARGQSLRLEPVGREMVVRIVDGGVAAEPGEFSVEKRDVVGVNRVDPPVDVVVPNDIPTRVNSIPKSFEG